MIAYAAGSALTTDDFLTPIIHEFETLIRDINPSPALGVREKTKTIKTPLRGKN